MAAEPISLSYLCYQLLPQEKVSERRTGSKQDSNKASIVSSIHTLLLLLFPHINTHFKCPPPAGYWRGEKPQCHLFILLHHGRPSSHSVIFKAAIKQKHPHPHTNTLQLRRLVDPMGSAFCLFFTPRLPLSDFFCQLPAGTCDDAGSRRERADMHRCKSASVKEHMQSVWGDPDKMHIWKKKGHPLHKIQQRSVCVIVLRFHFLLNPETYLHFYNGNKEESCLSCKCNCNIYAVKLIEPLWIEYNIFKCMYRTTFKTN